MDQSSKTASLRYGGLVLALALAIAILGAKAFSDAAGFHETSSSMGGYPQPADVLPRIPCGFVLFLLSWTLLRFLFRLGTQIVWRLGQVRERPGLPIAITLLACGTLCVLGALLLVWQGNTGGVNMSPAVNFPGNVPGVNVNMLPRLDLSMQTSGSLIRPLAVCAALVIGVALLALGVWSSLAPAAATSAPQNVPEEGGAP
jgi:hypothetical protein